MHNKVLHPSLRPSVEEWFTTPSVQKLDSSHPLDWGSLRLTRARLSTTPEALPTPQTSNYTLATVTDRPSHLRAHIVSEGNYEGVLSPGAVQLLTPQTEATATWNGPTTVLFIEIAERLVKSLSADVVRGDPDRVQIPPNINFQDLMVSTLIHILYHELHAWNSLSRLYVDSIANTLALHLLRHYSTSPTLTRPGGHRDGYHLSPAQIHLIDDYINVHLDQKLTLTVLAGLIGFSIPHFERTFRASFGRSPYQYVIERRVERARSLLSSRLTGDCLTLHDVARMCGFANQSHMTRHFSRIVGTTPSRFARHSQQ